MFAGVYLLLGTVLGLAEAKAFASQLLRLGGRRRPGAGPDEH
jgi:hypothetical protein